MPISYSPILDILTISDEKTPSILLSPYFLSTRMKNLKTTINLGYSEPLITMYEDIENDTQIIERLTKYFYYKTLDKWLYNEMVDVLNYFKINNGKVTLIDNLDKYKLTNIDSDNNETANNKIKYIEDNILSEKMMNEIINKFINENGLTWTRILKKQYSLRKYIEEKLVQLIQKLIREK